ncbi:HAD-IA family hydrolase [Candidatus Woesearchaeota archaeon]|nr:HAD-IA family hydrolase [Candidatus Woesearchaeota archaeon]
MIKAVIFDIYGTLLKTETGDLDDSLEEEELLLKSFSRVKEKYDLEASSEHLLELFEDNIDKVHQEKEKKGIEHPEVNIVEIWGMILDEIGHEHDEDLLVEIAYDHNHFNGKHILYPSAEDTLKELKKKAKLGIVSNAQFYTLIDMDNLLDAKLEDYFDEDILLFSYKIGFSKPNVEVFLMLKEKLKEKGIDASEAIYVGNDMLKDIEASKKAGFKACLFESPEVRLRKGEVDVEPDYRIKKLKEILKII